MRKIKELNNPSNIKNDLTKAKIYWNPELREYVVKFWDFSGCTKEAWTYYTDDKIDAISTAEFELGARN